MRRPACSKDRALHILVSPRRAACCPSHRSRVPCNPVARAVPARRASTCSTPAPLLYRRGAESPTTPRPHALLFDAAPLIFLPIPVPSEPPVPQGLNLVYPWGAESGDAWGDGAAFDGDGVGDNASDDANYPYNANGARAAVPAAFA